jgi:hypothetical protein
MREQPFFTPRKKQRKRSSGAARAPLLELGVRGSALNRKYNIYLDCIGIAKVPEDYEDRLTEMFPSAYQHLRICALDPYDLALSNTISSAIATT